MGRYILGPDGKRYYQDDRNGTTTIDNVSEAQARARENKANTGTRSGRTDRGAAPYSYTSTGQGTGTSTHSSILPALLVLLITAAAVFVIASGWSRTSAEEKAIQEYMENRNNSDTQEEYDEYDEYEEYDDYEEDYYSEGSMLMPASSSEYLSDADLENYSDDEIQMMINEIYARHGNTFETESIQSYFSAQDWYEPQESKTDEDIVAEFNEYERANVNMMSAMIHN